MNLPDKDTAGVLQDLATVAGIIIGGAWAFWRWSLSEYLRHRREMPAFEGELSARAVPEGQGRLVLTASCKWKNVSAIPLRVNTKETKFRVFEIPPGLPLGPIAPRLRHLDEKYVRAPWEHWDGAVLEPGTNSELQAHFLVDAGRTYVIACGLEAVQVSKDVKQVWTRELVWRGVGAEEKAGAV
jgi:hypothetical protein